MLVFVAEGLGAELLGQVEVAVHAPAADDPHAQEGVHGRVGGGGSRRSRRAWRVSGSRIGRASRMTRAEDAVPAGRRPDPGSRVLRRHPVGGEALEQPAVGGEHADGRELRTNELGGRFNRVR